MRADDMKEAIEKGYLGGKTNIPKTFKFSHEMLDGMMVASEVNNKEVADWLREIIARELLLEDAKYDRMTRARERAKSTWNTLVHHEKSPSVGADELDIQNLEGNEQ